MLVVTRTRYIDTPYTYTAKVAYHLPEVGALRINVVQQGHL